MYLGEDFLLDNINMKYYDILHKRYFLDEYPDYSIYEDSKNDFHDEITNLNEYIYNSAHGYYLNYKVKKEVFEKEYWEYLLTYLKKEYDKIITNESENNNNNNNKLELINMIILDIDIMRNINNVNKKDRLDGYDDILLRFKTLEISDKLLLLTKFLKLISLVNLSDCKHIMVKFLNNLSLNDISKDNIKPLNNSIILFVIKTLYELENRLKINDNKLFHIYKVLFIFLDKNSQLCTSIILYSICNMNKKYQDLFIIDYEIQNTKVNEYISNKYKDIYCKKNKKYMEDLIDNITNDDNKSRIKIYELLDNINNFVLNNSKNIYSLYHRQILSLYNPEDYILKCIIDVISDKYVLYSNKYLCCFLNIDDDNISEEMENFLFRYSIDILCLILKEYSFFDNLSTLNFIDNNYYKDNNLGIYKKFIKDFINNHDKSNYYLSLLKFNNKFEMMFKDLFTFNYESYVINEFKDSVDTFAEFIKDLHLIDEYFKKVLINILVSRSGSNLRNYVSHCYFKFNDYNELNSLKCYLILFLLLNKQFVYFRTEGVEDID